MSPKPVCLQLCDVQDEEREFKRFNVLTHDGSFCIAHVVNRIDQDAVRSGFEGTADPDKPVVFSVFDVTFYGADGEASEPKTFDDNMQVLEAIEAWAQAEGLPMYPEGA